MKGNPMRVFRIVAGSALLLAFLYSLADQADARQWTMNATAKALDYTQIIDQRSKNELVLVWWLAPKALGLPQNNRRARAIFEKYTLVVVAHGHFSAMGNATFTSPTGIQVRTSKGKVRQPIAEEAWPRALTGFVTEMRAALPRAIGKMGKGMKFFVFKDTGIRQCRTGAFSIKYAGERYKYETPIPGCR